MRTPASAPSLALRVSVTGVVAMALVGLLGTAWLFWRLGPDPDATLARVERDVRERFARDAALLSQAVARVQASADVPRALDTSTRDPRVLFDALDETARQTPDSVALTIATADGTALAWAGRPQAVPLTFADGRPALVLAPGALGLRLVYVEPIRARAGTVIGAVAAERLLSRPSGMDARDTLSAPYETGYVPVTLVPRFIGAVGDPNEAYAITLSGPTGDPLADVSVSRAAIAELRVAWWYRLLGFVGLTGAGTLLVLAGVLAWERRFRAPAVYRRFTLFAFLALVATRIVLWFAWMPLQSALEPWARPVYQGDSLSWLHRTPIDLCVTALLLLSCVMLAVDPLRRWRLAWRVHRTRPSAAASSRAWYLASLLAGGAVLAALVHGLASFVLDTVAHTALDVSILSLLPRLALERLPVPLGLLALGTAAFWAGVMALRVSLLRWNRSQEGLWLRVALPLIAWSLPLAAWLVWLGMRGGAPSVFASLLIAVSAGVATLATSRGLLWFRHGTQPRRLLTVYGALLLPALLLYPLLLHAVDKSRRQLVTTEYAPQVVSHPQDLLARLTRSLDQLDATEDLAGVIAAVPRETGTMPTEPAFALWSRTDLARARLTSAVELYAPDGPLVSRFGFNFPEYQATVPQWRGALCEWDVFGEAAVFGSEERSMLHAERAVCEGPPGQTRVRGGVILHVMVDYSALPFLSTRGPYFDLFGDRTGDDPARSEPRARDIDLVVYGWGRSPIYSVSERVWPLPQSVFDRAYASRTPFWDRQVRGNRAFDIYVSNDRFGIYVVGVPRVTPIEHLVHIAEVATLAALLLLLILSVHALLHVVNRRGPQPATLLVREVRASFTRKLFLAFVATSVIPVLTLALLVRTFVASRLRADVTAEATRTAAVAQRVIEEALAVQQPGLVTATALSDDVMVWISRVIKQDVNIFDGPTLLATSQRDLFAQGLLPERTPDTVYRAIVLQRLPTFVGEDQIGPLQYQLAATPIRVGTRDAILTVPMTLRQREIEREIAELDRRVNLGAVIFILLGAALGYSISGRIGDPVQRLTRASRRIAAGDLDHRVVARTADELQRLVEAFNSMADELKRQREQLQRTNRLEAWAEMARQVAHDIKNPLTPIQLSAEHLRRVHRDRGEPLSPVLDQCVDTILRQVRMLRQISSEFASFASTPVARVAPVSVRDLVDEVLSGYRIGLPSGVRVEADLPDGLPQVLVDLALLGRAMINVIENALHAMPGGGTVTIGATHDEPWVRLSLTDTGVGMDDAALARLFEPYFSTKAAGTGLGLTIAKRNVELMGGQIDVTSQKGVGTTVTLSLPVARA